MKFSEKIMKARRLKGLTQEDLAEAAGVSRQAVSKWETGEAKPDLEKLVSICAVLDLSMDYLCMDQDPELTVAMPPKQAKVRKWLALGACVGFVVALLLSAIAWVTIKPGMGRAEGTAETYDYSALVKDLSISHASIRYAGVRQQRITVTLNAEYPGMEVQLSVMNKTSGSSGFIETEQQGFSYSGIWYVPNGDAEIVIFVVCTIDDVTVQLPVYELTTGDNGTSISRIDLWNT